MKLVIVIISLALSHLAFATKDSFGNEDIFADLHAARKAQSDQMDAERRIRDAELNASIAASQPSAIQWVDQSGYSSPAKVQSPTVYEQPRKPVNVNCYTWGTWIQCDAS